MNPRILNAALIGRGQIASTLGPAWEKKGIVFRAFGNRSRQKPEGFAGPSAFITDDFSQIPADVDAILVAVSDDAIENVILQLPAGPTIIHFSGSTRTPSPNGAVLWPVQSIRKEDFREDVSIPFVVSSSSADVAKKIETFASLISNDLTWMPEDARFKAHMAAVFAANFTNHCLAMAQLLCKEANLPWEKFEPMLETIIQRGLKGQAVTHQTGPALRHDERVIQQHLSLLEDSPSAQAVYKSLTESIQNLHDHND